MVVGLSRGFGVKLTLKINYLLMLRTMKVKVLGVRCWVQVYLNYHYLIDLCLITFVKFCWLRIMLLMLD